MQKEKIKDRLARLLENCNVPRSQMVAVYLVSKGVNFGKKPKWIPVSERLPNEGQSVLVYRKSKKMIAPHVSLCRYNGVHEKNEWSRRTDHVMYWMPLPELPKEVEQ